MTDPNEAIRVLLADEVAFSIVLDDAPDFPVVPDIITKESSDNDESGLKLAGEVEYMVSDGFPGNRSASIDVYSWEEAVATAKRLQSERKAI